MKNIIHITISSILLFLVTFCQAADTPPMIPEDSFSSLQAELAELKTSRKSSSSKRRSCKGVIREAQGLIKDNPEAPNRFRMLALILKAQKQLLIMESNERNRDAFFKTCEELAKAPDEYSKLRLNAQLILSERELSARDADAKERGEALKKIINGYLDTPGELEALTAGISIATQLGNYDLKKEFVEAMSQRFAGNPSAIAYRRKLIGASKMDILFSGTFERLDETSISFPFDRLGHPYYVVFWSKTSPLAIQKLKQLKEQQDESPDLLEIYSMNLDELPDAGNSIINEIGLKCTVLKLPGGRNSDAFLTYALHQPSALRVNQYGHALTPPTISAHAKNEKDADEDEEELPHSRGFDEFVFPVHSSSKYYLGINHCERIFQQIQSIFIGDVLVLGDGWKSNNEDSVDSKTISDIRACFVRPPMRYRLSKTQAYENYKKANDLCVTAITKYSNAPDLWRLRNYRIIALIGMANLKGNPEYFNQAVKESKTNAALSLPADTRIIPQFCMAIDGLRKGKEIKKKILENFISQCKDAEPIAYCAASILAMHADSRDLYNKYRKHFLESKDIPAELDSFTSFLKDRYHQFYVFKGSPSFYLYSRIYRFVEQNYLVDNGLVPLKEPLPNFQLKTLDGKTISLPDNKGDKMILLLFVEPPAGGNDELPGNFYSPAPAPSKRRKNPRPGGELGYAYYLAENHGSKAVTVITAFLTDNVKQIKAIQKKYSLPGVIALVPDGLKNPLVNRLGIVSPDRMPNSILVRRNGTIAWSKKGLPYHMIGINRHTHINGQGILHHIWACDAEAGLQALKKKDFKAAINLFSGPFIDGGGGWHKWESTFAHGRALANIGLKDYETALANIDEAMSQHLRRGNFNHDPEKPCTSMIHMLTTKAKILDALGRKTEARAARNKAALEPTDYPTTYSRVMGFNRPYEAFEERLSIIAKEIK